MRLLDRMLLSRHPSFHITSAVVLVDTTSTATLEGQEGSEKRVRLGLEG